MANITLRIHENWETLISIQKIVFETSGFYKYITCKPPCT